MWAKMLLSLVGPVLARILVSLGVSLVTMVGLVAAVATLKATVVGKLAGLPVVTLQLGGLFGLWIILGMFFGSLTFIMAWKATKGFMAVVKNP